MPVEVQRRQVPESEVSDVKSAVVRSADGDVRRVPDREAFGVPDDTLDLVLLRQCLRIGETVNRVVADLRRVESSVAVQRESVDEPELVGHVADAGGVAVDNLDGADSVGSGLGDVQSLTVP